jgi:hypothetical protein
VALPTFAVKLAGWWILAFSSMRDILGKMDMPHARLASAPLTRFITWLMMLLLPPLSRGLK